MKKVKALTLKECLLEAAAWNRADIRGIDDITPDLPMLKARARILRVALALLKPQRATFNGSGYQ